MANATYDVFVSYSRADWCHAADIDSLLRAKGLTPFFDRRSLAPGLRWVRALEQAIGAAKAAIVLIGPRGLGNTQQYERDLALIRQTHDPAFPIVPVILPETTSDPPFDFLRVLTWVDFSHVAKVSGAPDVLEHLLAAIHGREAAPEAAREANCPYRGLDAFREEDSAFFFGRGSADDPKSPIGDARLQKIKFTEANLNGSVFDQARLCDVDFSRAELTDASFLNVTYEPALPNFKDTAWWLSTGWNLQQVDLFRKQQGGHDLVVPDNRRTLSQNSPAYCNAMQTFEGNLKSSSNDTLKRAVALNGMAWYTAIWGLDLADAEKSAQEAVNIIHALKPEPDLLTVSYVEDALAYILLQMGRTQDARKSVPFLSFQLGSPTG